MAPYKRKTSRALVTAATIEGAKRKLEAGKSKERWLEIWGSRVHLENKIESISLGRFKRALTDDMERELVQHCRDLDSRFYGLTRKHVMKIAFDFAEMNGVCNRSNKEKQMADKDWLKGFCKRNKLYVRTPEQCSMARATGFNKMQVSRKVNVDETGLSTVPNRMPKVLTPTGKKKKTVCKVPSAERRETITAVCCMCATGIFVPSALIFPRKRMNHLLFKSAPSGTLSFVTETGYTNSDLFLDWLKHFAHHVKPSAEDPILLVADNHSTHCSLLAISHIIQPLDKGLFSPLKAAHASEAGKWLVQHPGEVIRLTDVAGIFKEAYTATARVKLAGKAFEVTGIKPFNPDVLNEELFAPSLVTEQPLNEVPAESARPSTEKPLNKVPAEYFHPSAETDNSSGQPEEKPIQQEKPLRRQKRQVRKILCVQKKISNASRELQFGNDCPRASSKFGPNNPSRRRCRFHYLPMMWNFVFGELGPVWYPARSSGAKTAPLMKAVGHLFAITASAEVDMEQRRNARTAGTGGTRGNPPRPATSSGTSPTCGNLCVIRRESGPSPPWWEASGLPTVSPRPLFEGEVFDSELDFRDCRHPALRSEVRKRGRLPVSCCYHYSRSAWKTIMKFRWCKHFYIRAKIKLDSDSELRSFDLGSRAMLVQPALRGQWRPLPAPTLGILLSPFHRSVTLMSHGASFKGCLGRRADLSVVESGWPRAGWRDLTTEPTLQNKRWTQDAFQPPIPQAESCEHYSAGGRSAFAALQNEWKERK
ncbi:hypothetical protein PR048_023061 [Dryococelus australis]|uniref:DDE-1 domain-containing protein n=1 Tax=Dryococelus australis TaxID=614101 RepID=A0ABQ9GT34_9NEOP|nr:hypothetical protein PR048_023061 [Dryococelus australis]